MNKGLNMPSYNTESLIRRLLDKRSIDENGCWNFTGSIGGGGYGQIWFIDKLITVHRAMAYLCLGLDLRDDKIAMHKCDNRRCFNPLHIQVGTHIDNMRDCSEKGRIRGNRETQDFCDRGHEISGHNAKREKDGRKRCRICINDAQRRRRDKAMKIRVANLKAKLESNAK